MLFKMSKNRFENCRKIKDRYKVQFDQEMFLYFLKCSQYFKYGIYKSKNYYQENGLQKPVYKNL